MLLLGCSSDNPLKSLDFSLCLQRIMLSGHLLIAEAAILYVVRVVKEEAGFIVLDATREQVSICGGIPWDFWVSTSYLCNRVSSTTAKT